MADLSILRPTICDRLHHGAARMLYLGDSITQNLQGLWQSYFRSWQPDNWAGGAQAGTPNSSHVLMTAGGGGHVKSATRLPPPYEGGGTAPIVGTNTFVAGLTEIVFNATTVAASGYVDAVHLQQQGAANDFTGILATGTSQWTKGRTLTGKIKLRTSTDARYTSARVRLLFDEFVPGVGHVYSGETEYTALNQANGAITLTCTVTTSTATFAEVNRGSFLLQIEPSSVLAADSVLQVLWASIDTPAVAGMYIVPGAFSGWQAYRYAHSTSDWSIISDLGLTDLVYMLGQNHAASGTYQEYKSDYEALTTLARAANPKISITAIAPYQTGATAGATVRSDLGEVRQWLYEMASADANMQFVDLYWLLGSSALVNTNYLSDGVHAHKAGTESLCAVMWNAIRAGSQHATDLAEFGPVVTKSTGKALRSR